MAWQKTANLLQGQQLCQGVAFLKNIEEKICLERQIYFWAFGHDFFFTLAKLPNTSC